MTEAVGRYEIFEEIGQGGFAIVYRGRDTSLDRPVAMKELRPMLLQDKSWVKRFQREARTIARLDHPHIVPIYDIHEAENRLFIVMRLVEGQSLEDLISSRGKLPWQMVVETMVSITTGLDYAHSNEILHRDLKPANILMDSHRGPLLSDFGLAKMVGSHSISMTESGSIVGTPHYISPEVWEGKGTTQRSDVYALGCILYEMLTGEKVFKGETPPAVMMAHFKPLTLPEVWPDDVPPGVATVLRTALAQAPEERYESAIDIGHALVNLSPGLAIRTSTTITPIPTPKPKTESPAPTGTPLPHPAAASTSQGIPADNRPQEQTPALPSPEPQPATPLPAPTPSPPPTPGFYDHHSEMGERKHRRFGCLQKGSVFGLVFVALLFIGLTTFCAAFGSNAGSNITTSVESLTKYITDRVQVGRLVSQPIQVPVPDHGGTTRLEIDLPAGTFTLGSGTQEMLVEGTATYNVEMLKPKVAVNGRNVRISPEGATEDVLLLTVYNFINTDIQNVWDLKLGNSPINLNLNTGTSEGQIQFNEISLVDLTISQPATGSLDLSFLEPNQVEMEMLELSGGLTKRTALTGLANARARNISLTAQTGEFTLDFSGQLQNDVNANITGATDVWVNIIIPKGVAAQVVTSNGIKKVDIPDAWQTDEKNRYAQEGQGHQIFIKIEGELSAMKLRSR